MDLIDIHLLMDSGHGVEPEVLLFKDFNNHLSIRLSKKFMGERHYQQFDIVHPAINKKAKDQLNSNIEYNINKLQRYIDNLNKSKVERNL